MGDEPKNPDSVFLDQSEIDKLLAQTGQAPEGNTVLLAAGHRNSTEAPKIENYDFRRPAFLSEAELRRLRLLHEDFVQYLSARLSVFLRMEFGIKLAALTTISYAKFTEVLPSPTHICLFKVEPLKGVGLISINPRLALTVADRLLGGRGHSVKAERHLTEIEAGLLEDVVMITLEEWCDQWKEEMHPEVCGHETNARFLETSPHDAIVLQVTLEVSFGDCAEQIHIGIPYYTIEPLVKKMQLRRQKDTAYATSERKPAAWSAA